MSVLQFDDRELPSELEIKKSVTDVLEIPFVKEKLSQESDGSQPCHASDDDDSGCPLNEFSWVPPSLEPKVVYQYMRSLPETKVPYVGSVGDRYRTVQLLRQLPVQDSDAKYCHGLSDEEKKELSTFAECRRKEALGRGVVRVLGHSERGSKCKECQVNMKPGDVTVMALRIGDDASWHPRCFVCHQCKELLVDLIYFSRDGFLYCGRHHSELIKPRCVACDELILTEECTEAEGQMWHMKHFTCNDCESQLGGQRYVMRDGHPICCGCYDASHAERCQSCEEPIGIDQGLMELNGSRWHATDECFQCHTCHKPLVGRHFMPKDNLLFCSVCAVIALDVTKTDSPRSGFRNASSFELEAKESDICARMTNSKDSAERNCTRSENESEYDFRGDSVVASYQGTDDAFKINRSMWKDDPDGSRGLLSEETRVNPNDEGGLDDFGSQFDQDISEHRRQVRSQWPLMTDGFHPSNRFHGMMNDSPLRKEEELIDMYQSQSLSHPFIEDDSQSKFDGNFESLDAKRRVARQNQNEKPNYESTFQNVQRLGIDSHLEISRGKNIETCADFDIDDAKTPKMRKGMSVISEELKLSRGKKSVRFDPSTKGARTPSPREEFRRRLKHQNHAPLFSRDDWDVWSEGHGRRQRTSAYSLDGRRPRTSGYSSDGAVSKSKRLSGYFSDSASHRPKSASGYASDGARSNWSSGRNVQRSSHEARSWQKGKENFNDFDAFHFKEFDEDNIEKCSTCSSSSDSSDFYETASVCNIPQDGDYCDSPAFQKSSSSYLYSDRYRTLPSSSRVTFADVGVEGKMKKKKKKKHMKTNCVLS